MLHKKQEFSQKIITVLLLDPCAGVRYRVYCLIALSRNLEYTPRKGKESPM